MGRSLPLGCLCLALAISAALRAGTYNEISVDQAYAILSADGSVFLLDVRSQDEYEEGHIPGAYLIPHTEIAQRKAELPADLSAPVVVYCLAGYRSAQASSVLSDLGYSNVSNVAGGFSEWKAKGYPYVVGADRGSFAVPDSFSPLSAVVLWVGLALALRVPESGAAISTARRP